MGIGDWGLGIGQSPIPNPQSPIYLSYNTIKNIINNIIKLRIIL